jgi:hypothetical protein
VAAQQAKTKAQQAKTKAQQAKTKAEQAKTERFSPPLPKRCDRSG